MTDRPIIFTGPEVRATLDGRKTQFRRVLRPQPTYIESSGRWKWNLPPRAVKLMAPGHDHVYTASREFWEYAPKNAFPYAPGDSLWVRESFIAHGGVDHCIQGYRADGYEATVYWEIPRPSVHMPRWASRLTLTVTDVRVQRVQDISEDDARAEGAQPWTGALQSYRAGFYHQWDSRHAKRGFGWDANPWVAAVTFTAERRNIGDEHG